MARPKKLTGTLSIIKTHRFHQEDVDLLEALEADGHGNASEILRKALREYASNHSIETVRKAK